MLDDAIRQHLELKRRHGAPEDEVKRLESEALSPARREPVIAPPVDQPPASELPPPPAAPPAAAAPAEPAAPAPPAPAPAAADDTWLEDDAIPAAEMPTAIHHQPTSEYSADEVHEAQGAPVSDYVAPDEEGEDLLEETPDFLQETPEHDRLWFEQKPPRDFDFDR